MQTEETMTPAVPNPANWGPDDWRAQWEVPVTPPDHTMRLRPDGTGISVEIDMPGKKGIAGWCFLSPEDARGAARRLNRYADELTPASTEGLAVERAGTTIVLGDTFELSLEQAGNLGRALLHLRDELTPASELGLGALRDMLNVINDARGTSHTVESIAASLGMEQPLSQSESSEIARHVGGVLMH